MSLLKSVHPEMKCAHMTRLGLPYDPPSDHRMGTHTSPFNVVHEPNIRHVWGSRTKFQILDFFQFF